LTATWARHALALCSAVTLLASCTAKREDEARELLARGAFAEALPILRTLVDEEPKRPELQLLYARALIGNRDESMRAATRVLEAEPEHPAALQLRMRAHLGARQGEAALEDAATLIDRDPSHHDAQMGRIEALLVLERADDAEVAIREQRARLAQAGNAAPEVLRAQMCLLEATFLAERGDSEAGEHVLESCLEAHPGDPRIVGSAIAHFDAQVNPIRAFEIAQSAVEAAPDELDHRILLAQLHARRGDPRAGAQVLAEATSEGRPGAASAWYALYDFHWQLAAYAEALDAYEHFLALVAEPSTTQRINHADALIHVGDFAGAGRVASELAPQYADLLLGRIALAEERPEEALERLERAIAHWPSNATARWLAGIAAERLGQLALADAHYIEAYRIEHARGGGAPETDAALRLARLRRMAGAYDAALQFATAYIDDTPKRPEGYLEAIRIGRAAGLDDLVARMLAALEDLPGQAERARELRARLAAGAPEAPHARLDAEG
jgi:Flp pilus assembly protein TadD